MADNLNGADITPDKDNITGSVNNSGIDSPVNDSDNITGNADNTSPDNDSINNSSDSQNKDDKGKRNGEVFDSSSNLIPFGSKRDNRSKEEVREINAKGGRKSGETRRKQRDMREIAKAILEHAMKEEQIEEVLGSSKDLLDGDKSVMAVLTARMVQEAGKGSYKHYETLRDTAGFKPKDEIGISADIMTDADRELIEKVNRRLEAKKA